MEHMGQLPIHDSLSPREMEVLELLSQGKTNHEIAEELFLSIETIKWYNKQIYGKLGVNSRTQAVHKANSLNLLGESTDTEPSSAPSYNLPAQVTTFIGREQEVTEILQLLKTSRLVTLTGPGGAGKTRLGLKVGELAAGSYADGIVFVSLSSIADHTSVPNAVAQELGVVEKPPRTVIESLQLFLSRREMLLILDTFEHVLASSPLLVELLLAAPRLTILATSREALNLTGEYVYPVPPLPLPESGSPMALSIISDFASLELFVQRSQAAAFNFHVTDADVDSIVKICTLVDGLPLAIELAAARTKLFTPEQLLARMESRLDMMVSAPRDLPRRQRTLRDTIAWSYNLLSSDEQNLFMRLGAFFGGFSLEAVEAVCVYGLDLAAFDGIESLFAKSLVVHSEQPGGQPRFMMLDTIHEFARERLAGSDDESLVRTRHLEYFVTTLEKMEPGFWQHDQLILLEQTKVEMENIRRAFDFAMKTDRVEAAARLISAIDYYYKYRDLIVEGKRKFRQVLDRIDAVPELFQGRLLLGAARLEWVGGDESVSERLGRQALSMARKLGDRHIEAWALAELSGTLIDQPEEYGEAEAFCKQAMTIFRDLNELPGLAYSLNILGELARFGGDYQKARRAYEESLDICRETGEIYRQSMMLANLAFVAYDEGDYEQVREYALSIIQQRLAIAWQEWAIIGLAVLAGPLAKLGQPEKAVRLLGASEKMLNTLGIDYQPGDQTEISKYLAEVHSQVDPDTFEALWKEGQSLTFEEAADYALSRRDAP